MRRSSKLQPYFGVLWDKRGNPFCPSCKNHLSNYDLYGLYFGFYCTVCKNHVHLRDNDGGVIQLYMVNKYFVEQGIMKILSVPQK
jgi:hypothetical protein